MVDTLLHVCVVECFIQSLNNARSIDTTHKGDEHIFLYSKYILATIHLLPLHRDILLTRHPTLLLPPHLPWPHAFEQILAHNPSLLSLISASNTRSKPRTGGAGRYTLHSLQLHTSAYRTPQPPTSAAELWPAQRLMHARRGPDQTALPVSTIQYNTVHTTHLKRVPRLSALQVWIPSVSSELLPARGRWAVTSMLILKRR